MRRVQAVKPRDFAMQINLAMENCWGIVRALCDVCSGLADGSWLLVKDPNKPLLRLYGVPADAFKVPCPHGVICLIRQLGVDSMTHDQMLVC